MGRDDILTPRAVEGLIADGKKVVIFEDYVLNLDSWLQKHPGGDLVILHMVGRDATDEIEAYHSAATLRTMKAFRIGRKPAGPWMSMTPPIRGGVFRKLDQGEESACPDASEDNDSVIVDSVSDSGSSKARDSDEDDVDALDRGSSPISSATSDCSSDAVVKPADGEGLRKRLRAASDSAAAAAGASADADRVSGAGDRDIYRRLSPAEYTDWAMEQDLASALKDYPSVEPLIQQNIASKYKAMHQKVHEMGFYDCPYIEYGKECARYLTLFTTFLVLLRHEWYIPSAFFLGLFWHQIMFTAHDAGHRAITHNMTIDTLIGLFIADFTCGLSIGWWKSSHNVHHLITNSPEHDPDIQNLPLFATCPSFFKSLVSSYYNFTFVWDKAAEFLVPYQNYTYYPIMCVSRFHLYTLSWMHVLSSRSSGLAGSSAWWIRPTEILFMTCYWFLFGYCLVLNALPDWYTRVAFVLVSHMTLMPLHVQITLSHWGMSTTDLGESESFAQRQLRTTMDVDCPAWMDFVHGGLQFQVIHHLFPRVPRHNLRKVQALVRDFCEETEIPYSLLSFVDGNKKVLGRLEEIGEQVTMMVRCQQFMAETGESGLH